MNDDVLERAARVYAQALERPAGEREKFVTSSCISDPELLTEVRTLLGQADDADAFGEDLVGRVDAISSLLAEAGNETIGTAGEAIGPYRLIEPLGRGGMSTVWRAARQDGAFEGEVAVKLLLRRDDAKPLPGFEIEAQTLVTLSHPNVARLFDAGVDDSGRPYLILELVEGIPIDAYCDEQRLPITERVRMFLDVLGAVAHAHSHLIVHRDIKPSNVLVCADGTVKLLDFGIATLLDPRSASGDAGPPAQEALTPEFAAPEQLLSEPVTTSTDVYSLGLLLYVLLSGVNPRTGHTASTFGDLVARASELPPKPSTLIRDSDAEQAAELSDLSRTRAATPLALQRSLCGDLDHIVEKALQPSSEDRYSSVNEFANDLQRFLADEPVSAMPPQLAYRARKFVARHRGGVASALLTLLALVSTALFATWQMFEARAQRDIAVYQQQRVQAANEFYGLLLEEVNAQGEPFAPVELLDRAAALLDAQLENNAEFPGRPFLDLVHHYKDLDENATANRRLEGAAEMAARTGDTALAATIDCVRIAATFGGDLAAQRVALQGAVAALSRSAYASLDDRFHCSFADFWLSRAEGDLARATDVLLAALDDLRAAPAAPVRLQAKALNALGIVYYERGMYDEMLAANRDAQALNEQNGRGNTYGQLRLLVNRATMFGILGELAAATELRRMVVQRMQAMAPDGRGTYLAAQFYVTSLMRISRYDEALDVLHGIRERRPQGEDELLDALLELTTARLQVRRGDLESAARHLQLAEQSDALRADPNYRRNTQRTRIELELARANLDAAAILLDDLLVEMNYPANKTHNGLTSTLQYATELALRRGEFAEALRLATDKLAIDEQVARSPELSADVGRALALRARASIGLGRTNDARDDLRRAVISLRNGLGADNPEVMRARDMLEKLDVIRVER